MYITKEKLEDMIKEIDRKFQVKGENDISVLELTKKGYNVNFADRIVLHFHHCRKYYFKSNRELYYYLKGILETVDFFCYRGTYER